ncbi:MAG: hypothetical protein CVV05_00775 [Gammaproteobacteria bacterium HGW-Gammaproteobacteria-1]|jgi:chromosome partitioning protein|nr:MAG: hypothetical protein CVV05_00775 [Gammaproteobacteria bacterium HGW-Gammaproteobacteria-1]
MARYRGGLKVFAVVQQKGGVGKTTTSRNIGEYMARYRKVRVLLVDFDPQCNLSMRYLKMEKPNSNARMPPVHDDFDPAADYENGWTGRSSSASMFYDDVVLPYDTEIPGMDILPGDGKRLREAEMDKPAELERKIINRLYELLSDDDAQETYDFVVIDTGPNRLSLTQAALRAATHLLMPLQPEKMNTETLSDMIDLWREENTLRDPGGELKLVGIMPSLCRGTALHKGVIRSLRQDPGFGDLVTPFVINYRTVVAEADHESSKHSSVFDLPDSDPAKKEALTMCRFVEDAVFGDVTR